MIFVTLGTQDKPFERILDLIDKSNVEEDIIVQGGFTTFNSPKMQMHTYFSPDELTDNLVKSRIVVTHGGVGSIMQGLKLKKKIVALPRLAKYGEHQNDHQLEIVRAYAKRGYILEWQEGESFDDVLARADCFAPMQFESNHSIFLSKLKEYIQNNV
ncbi:MAG: hypothetical protein K6D92_04645 [Erysipelotrichaceae bacterium]|jgi:UDP-N-acetylglucosamine transferase subunit ALG13|nr:hypothetical protein [Erysipelotrichaceae bacterium]